LKIITKEIDVNTLVGIYPIMFEESTIKEYLDEDKGNICIIGLDNDNNKIIKYIIYNIYHINFYIN